MSVPPSEAASTAYGTICYLKSAAQESNLGAPMEALRGRSAGRKPTVARGLSTRGRRRCYWKFFFVSARLSPSNPICIFTGFSPSRCSD